MTERPDVQERAQQARRLLRSHQSGILSTHSAELAGYPFGSVTPYVCGHDGRIAVLVSAIAEHTANMRADEKVCLTVVEEGAGNQQALGRLTMVGDARPVPADAVDTVEDRYFRLFPEARHYSQAHDFEYFWIEPRRARLIVGFGQICWVGSEDWCLAAPDWSAGEVDALDHMNEDHAESVRAIAERLGAAETSEARMVALDAEGCHIQAGAERVYAPFATRAMTSEQLRLEMIGLARRA